MNRGRPLLLPVRLSSLRLCSFGLCFFGICPSRFLRLRLTLFLPLGLSVSLPLVAAPPALAARLAATVGMEGEQDRSLRERPAASRSALEGRLGLRLEASSSLAARLDARLLHDAQDPERDRLRLDEGYARAAFGAWEATLGRQILDWGRLDALRAVDVFRRRDWIDPIDPLDQGSWAARVDRYQGAVTLEGIWIPRFEPDRIPFRSENPFSLFPDSISLPQGTFPARFENGGAREPSPSALGSEAGLRADLRLGVWDAGLSLARSRERIASVYEFLAPARAGGDGVASIRTRGVHRSLWMFGLDFARPAGGSTVHAEAALFDPDRAGGESPGAIAPDRPFLRAGIGWERGLPHGLLGRPLRLSGTYAFDQAARRPRLDDGGDPAILGHPFRHAALLRVRWETGTDVAIETESLLDLGRGGESLLARVIWSPWSSTRLEAEIRSISGGPASLLGRYRENDSIRIRASYAFSASKGS
ncbi:MAG: hypothetical protein ACE15D_08370 [Candidatus Eisenbacteria bacterium]|nr:hypothetical protein [Candidatus Eisenbacteria bacterium]